MTREEFRFLAAGQIAYQRRGGTLDFKEMETYVDGALFGFDFAMRMLRRDPAFQLDKKSMQSIETKKQIDDLLQAHCDKVE